MTVCKRFASFTHELGYAGTGESKHVSAIIVRTFHAPGGRDQGEEKYEPCSKPPLCRSADGYVCAITEDREIWPRTHEDST